MALLKTRMFEMMALLTWVFGYITTHYAGVFSWLAVFSGWVMVGALCQKHWQHWTMRHQTTPLAVTFLIKVSLQSMLLAVVVFSLARHAGLFALLVTAVSLYYSAFAWKLYFGQPVFKKRRTLFEGD